MKRTSRKEDTREECMDLKEIDKEATKMDQKMPDEEKGTLRTSLMGGAMAKQDIANFNEDIDDDCNYCKDAKSTASHVAWECSFHKT